MIKDLYGHYYVPSLSERVSNLGHLDVDTGEAVTGETVAVARRGEQHCRPSAARPVLLLLVADPLLLTTLSNRRPYNTVNLMCTLGRRCTTGSVKNKE